MSNFDSLPNIYEQRVWGVDIKTWLDPYSEVNLDIVVNTDLRWKQCKQNIFVSSWNLCFS